MPISIANDQQPNEVLVIVSGETSKKEMLSFIVASRTGEQRELAFLFDVSAASVTLSGGEISQLASYAADQARKSPMGPVAFISDNPVTFGLSRIYQSYSAAAGRKNVGVFQTLSDARAWLAGLKR